MTLILENVDKKFKKSVEAFAKAINAKCKESQDSSKSHKKPSKRLLKAIEEVRNGEVEVFEDFESFKADLMK
ncbi:hypothetical protein [Helicobacter mastomyrinus]|uniref:Antitoxin n=1 Tax=Helicobacter mastomyrinus TaxID=287948 RepID=A0ABZ3F4V2_9HELI|nr:hypothetical protein [uncultured Helicobacter sp.]